LETACSWLSACRPTECCIDTRLAAVKAYCRSCS
jgi:hypothetical protein